MIGIQKAHRLIRQVRLCDRWKYKWVHLHWVESTMNYEYHGMILTNVDDHACPVCCMHIADVWLDCYGHKIWAYSGIFLTPTHTKSLILLWPFGCFRKRLWLPLHARGAPHNLGGIQHEYGPGECFTNQRPERWWTFRCIEGFMHLVSHPILRMCDMPIYLLSIVHSVFFLDHIFCFTCY